MIRDGSEAANDDVTFPRPLIPASPILSCGALRIGGSAGTAAIKDAGATAYVTSGRMALALALRQLGVRAGDSVLVPAYHCSSMLAPILDVGASCTFYRLKPDTSVDLEDVRAKIRTTTKVMLFAHYFGFPQASRAVRTVCDAHGVGLIEDCAHAFFGWNDGRPIGAYGDYAVGSLMKFFPVVDGGCLVSARAALPEDMLESCGMRLQMKSAFNALDRAFEYGRLPLLRGLLRVPLRAKDALWRKLKADPRVPASAKVTPAASYGSFGFDRVWINKRMSMPSRAIFHLSDFRRNVEGRRTNFNYLLERLTGLPGCRPLHPTLPNDVVPYVFPLVVDAPDPAFARLKRSGVPLLRWEFLHQDIDEEACGVSAAYSRCLFQLPCHQDLSPEEMDWLVREIHRHIGV